MYRLLFHLRNEPELLSFCEETIGRLEEYDAGHEGQLTETIQTYLELQGNVTRSAEALHLHRNGLLYRLNRIQDLAGVSLDNPTERLALQLALLARPLVKKRPHTEHHPEHLPFDTGRGGYGVTEVDIESLAPPGGDLRGRVVLVGDSSTNGLSALREFAPAGRPHRLLLGG